MLNTHCLTSLQQQEGTFFDEVMCVCNWPWNIDGCENESDGQENQAREVFGLHGPRPRCTKRAVTP